MATRNEARVDALCELFAETPALQKAFIRSSLAAGDRSNKGLSRGADSGLREYAHFLASLNVALLIALGGNGRSRLMVGYGDLDRLLGRPDWEEWQRSGAAWQRAEKATFHANLFPLGCQDLNWPVNYAELFGRPELDEKYIKHVAATRFTWLRAIAAEKRCRAVVCFGLGYEGYFRTAFCEAGDDGNQIHFGGARYITFEGGQQPVLILPHFSARPNQPGAPRPFDIVKEHASHWLINREVEL